MALADPVSPSDSTYCALVMSGTKKINLDPRIDELLNFVRSLDPTLVSFQRIPKWDDFDQLEHALAKLKALKTDLLARNELDDVIALAKASAEEVKGDAQIAAILNAVKESAPPQVYLPTQYDLSRLYENLLYSFNRELPSELRLPLKRLPFDQRKVELIEKGKQILRSQRKRFETQFSLTGFQSYAEFKQALAGYSDDAKKLMNLLDGGRYQFAMNRPESARWWVPKVGFQNQRATGTSRGSLNPEWRDKEESAMTGTPLSKYQQFDNELKPSYGYLKPLPESGLIQSTSSQQYGSDVYTFKKERVNNRLTWTAGDSLGMPPSNIDATDPEHPIPKTWSGFFVPWDFHDLAVPSLLKNFTDHKMGFEPSIAPPDIQKDPEFLQLKLPAEPQLPSRLAKPPVAPTSPSMPVAPPMPDFEGDLEAWRKKTEAYSSSPEVLQYIKDLAAYRLTDEYAKYQKDYETYSQELKVYQEKVAQYQSTSPEFKKYSDDLSAYNNAVAKIRSRLMEAPRYAGTSLAPFQDILTSRYLELQYFGPMTLDDVEAFEFRTNPPEGDFLQELKKRQIKILDGRKQPAVFWVE